MIAKTSPMVLRPKTIDLLSENYDVKIKRYCNNEYTIEGEKKVLKHILISELKLSEVDANDELAGLPDDYETCGQCGFDHSYEQREAEAWHSKHEPMYETFDKFMSKIINDEHKQPKAHR